MTFTVENSDDNVTFSWREYDFSLDLKAILPRCPMCDTDGSYASRIDSLNLFINLAIKYAPAKEGK